MLCYVYYLYGRQSDGTYFVRALWTRDRISDMAKVCCVVLCCVVLCCVVCITSMDVRVTAPTLCALSGLGSGMLVL